MVAEESCEKEVRAGPTRRDTRRSDIAILRDFIPYSFF
jgi:hypothetical protein